MLKNEIDPQMGPKRNWLLILARYREPDHARSVFELMTTLVLFAALWAIAWLLLSISYILTLAVVVPTAGLLVRLFIIQHDCGHGSFFRVRALNDWVGRAIGVLTITPYDVWRRSHATHHATHGNLDKRGIGDIDTLTAAEFLAMPHWRKVCYRLYRNPVVLFGVGPAFVFLLQNRLPFGFMREGWRPWISAMGTNIAIATVVFAMIWLVGFKPFLLVQAPITLLAASIGVWLFYVQHQFEDTVWSKGESWEFHDAALYGSSHYDLPPVLAWFTGNIGIHHVHHLYSRIPFYRLPQVLRDFPELANLKRLTLIDSFACTRLRLWDEGRQKLVSFRDAMKQYHLGAIAAKQNKRGNYADQYFEDNC